MSADLYDTLKTTACAHAVAYDSPDPWNPDKTLRFRAADCVHHLHPNESIPESFRGPMHQEQYTNALKTFAPIFDKFASEIQDVVVDVKTRMVTTRLKVTMDLKAVGSEEPAVKGYTAEYVYMTEMDDSGTKIVRMEEFLDPQRLLCYVFGKVERYNALDKLNY